MKKWEIVLLQIGAMAATVYSVGMVHELNNDIVSFLVGGIIVACFMVFSWADKQKRL